MCPYTFDTELYAITILQVPWPRPYASTILQVPWPRPYAITILQVPWPRLYAITILQVPWPRLYVITILLIIQVTELAGRAEGAARSVHAHTHVYIDWLYTCPHTSLCP